MYDNTIAQKIAKQYNQQPLTDFASVKPETALETLNLNWRESGFWFYACKISQWLLIILLCYFLCDCVVVHSFIFSKDHQPTLQGLSQFFESSQWLGLGFRQALS